MPINGLSFRRFVGYYYDCFTHIIVVVVAMTLAMLVQHTMFSLSTFSFCVTMSSTAIKEFDNLLGAVNEFITKKKKKMKWEDERLEFDWPTVTLWWFGQRRRHPTKWKLSSARLRSPSLRRANGKINKLKDEDEGGWVGWAWIAVEIAEDLVQIFVAQFRQLTL